MPGLTEGGRFIVYVVQDRDGSNFTSYFSSAAASSHRTASGARAWARASVSVGQALEVLHQDRDRIRDKPFIGLRMLREIADNLYPHPGRKRIGATPTRPRLLAGRPDSLHEDLGSRLAAWGGARFAGTAPLAGHIAEHCRPTGYVEPTAEALASIGKALAAIGEE